MEFARPQEVDLRDAWKQEDADFTPWLSKNLDYLDDLGLGSLSLIDTEVLIPGVKRRLDILAETADERLIAIENQYRAADHDHLTRGLAYAAGLETAALIVIAEEHHPEFRAVADYLNRSAEVLGDDGIAIFLLTVTVEKLGNFLIPRFEVVSRPNTWRAEMAASSVASGLSKTDQERRKSRREFWNAFLQEVRTDSSTTLFSNWTETQSTEIFMPAGIQGSSLYFYVRLRKEECIPYLYIDEGDAALNEAILEELFVNSEAIDEALGYQLIWDRKPGARACAVDAHPILNCGWGTDADIRNLSLRSAIDSYVHLKTILTPFLQQAFTAIS
jgi:hypothetical protein